MKRGLINAAMRMASLGDRAGAILITGTDKIRSGYGNGDCVMMDFDHSVFALSDSTERYSRASRDLLQRLNDVLAGKGAPRDLAAWRILVNEVYAAQDYRHKATFSCAAVHRQEDHAQLFVLNGGDSVIALLNRESGEAEYMSKPDMNFAGRSRAIAHVGELVVHQHHVVALFSDGLYDIAKLSGKTVFDFIAQMAEGGIGGVPARVRDCMENIIQSNKVEYDDASLLIFDPRAFNETEGGVLIMGGSTPQEEMRYQKNVRFSARWDRWLGVDEILGNDELARECGIRIIH